MLDDLRNLTCEAAERARADIETVRRLLMWAYSGEPTPEAVEDAVVALDRLVAALSDAQDALQDMALNSPQGRSPEWFQRRARLSGFSVALALAALDPANKETP